MTMTKLQAPTLNAGLRALDDSELDVVTGGIIDGCIRLPGLPPVMQPPTSNPPWFGPKWEQVGRTGTLS
jgi:hypothetical protein